MGKEAHGVNDQQKCLSIGDKSPPKQISHFSALKGISEQQNAKQNKTEMVTYAFIVLHSLSYIAPT